MSDIVDKNKIARENKTDKKHSSQFVGIIRWGEFCLNNLLNENNIPMYLDYIKWIEKLAKEYDYALSIPAYRKYKGSDQ